MPVLSVVENPTVLFRKSICLSLERNLSEIHKSDNVIDAIKQEAAIPSNKKYIVKVIARSFEILTGSHGADMSKNSGWVVINQHPAQVDTKA